MTVRWLDSLGPMDRQADYFDAKQGGLVLRVGRRDKVWYVLYRLPGQRTKHRLRIGPYPSIPLADAREAAYDAIKKAKVGNDPAVEVAAQRIAPTFGELVADFSQHWEAGPAWQKEAKRLLDRDVLPRWKGIKAQDLRRRDVLALMDAIAARGANTTARRTLAVVRKVLNWAVDREIVETNPAVRVHGPGRERQKERVLAPKEVQAFWDGLDSAHLDTPTRLALKFILATGQRPGEVRTMRWADVDKQARVWTLPTTKAGRTHRVPLTSLALKLIETAPRLSDFVFSGRSKERPLGMSSLSTAMRRSVAGMDGVSPATPHDLRRTAGTLMAEAGVPRLVISRVLNHAEGGVTAIYDRHSYDKEKAEALQKLERRLQSIVDAKPARHRRKAPAA